MTAAIAWLARARWWLVLGVVLALAAALAAQTLRLSASKTDLAELKAAIAAQDAADSAADTQGLALHSRLTQGNTHAFTTTMLGLALQAQSGATARAADAADIASLRKQLQRLATSKAYSDTRASAAGDIADQNRQLWSLVDEGVASVGQLRDVVGQGQEILAERDAQVEALQGQITADRTVLEAPTSP